MIAGTYTPFTVLDLKGAWSWSFTSVVWSLATAGVLLRLLHGRLFDRLVDRALPRARLDRARCDLAAALHALHAATLDPAPVGGALYTIGIVFHLWERLPFQTAIWHLFVVAAAAVHFAAVVISVTAPSSPA